MKIPQKKLSGFTLIELLVVISIISLLATLVVTQLGTARVKAREVKRKSDLGELKTAVNLYFDSNNAYPMSASSADVANDWPAAYKAQMNPYMPNLPKDPAQPLAGSQPYYSYQLTWSTDVTCNNHYVLWMHFEGTSDIDYGKYTCGFEPSIYFRVFEK